VAIFAGAVGITLFIAVFLGNYILKQNYSTGSRAASNQAITLYNRQLRLGLLSEENAVKRQRVISQQLLMNPRNTLLSGDLLSKEEIDILKKGKYHQSN